MELLCDLGFLELKREVKRLGKEHNVPYIGLNPEN